MSTATIARVLGVTAASTACGSRLSVCASTSANTGVAPSYMKQFAEATNEYGDVITSSPGPIPAIRAARWRPAVPLETAAAYGAPTRSANIPSKRGTCDPSDRCRDCSTSSTIRASLSSSHGRESGIVRAAVPGRLPLTPGEAGLRACGAGPYWSYCPAPRTLASFASDDPGTADSPASRLGGRARGVLEPMRPPFAAATHRVEEGRLDLARDRPRWADLLIVDRADGRHLRRGPRHEHLVGEIEVGADQARLLDAIAEILRDLDDRVARHPGEDRGGEVGRVDDAVLDDEDVLAGAIGDMPVVGHENRLVVAGSRRLEDRQHRVQIDACGFRDMRDGVHVHALPGRDL